MVKAYDRNAELFNLFWQDCNETVPKGQSWTKDVQEMYFRYRQAMFKASAFQLSHSAVELLDYLTQVQPARMRERLELSRLPFPKTWIELDYHHRLKHLYSLGRIEPPTVEAEPTRLGFLLEEADNDPLQWMVSIFTAMPSDRAPEDARAGIYPLRWFVDTQCRGMPEQMIIDKRLHFAFGQRTSWTMADGNRPRFDILSAMGYGYDTDDPRTLPAGHEAARILLDDTETHVVIAPQLRQSISIGIEPIVKVTRLEGDTKGTARIILKSLAESRGDVRFLCTALALINDVPVEFTPSRRPGKFFTMRGPKPFLNSTIVNISIPTKRRLKEVDRMLRHKEHEIHKRRHAVRGHWRTSDHRVNEKWIWRWSEKHRSYRWSIWIPNHFRGNADLGWVKHEYHVQKARS